MSNTRAPKGMRRMDVDDIPVRALEIMIAMSEGWGWVMNGSKRSGDSFAESRDGKHKPRWPIGARCLVSEAKRKDVNEDTKNWNGWFASNGKEPLCEASFYDVPKYTSNAHEAMKLLEKYHADLRWSEEDKVWGAKITDEGGECLGFGPTIVIAVFRARVAQVYDPDGLDGLVLVPKEFLEAE